jgi:hypothetical protein
VVFHLKKNKESQSLQLYQRYKLLGCTICKLSGAVRSERKFSNMVECFLSDWVIGLLEWWRHFVEVKGTQLLTPHAPLHLYKHQPHIGMSVLLTATPTPPGFFFFLHSQTPCYASFAFFDSCACL